VNPLAKTAEEIFAAIDAPQTEVISFDVFDTLLVRPVIEPSDLFLLLDAPWQTRGNAGGFTPFRKQAEKRAKQRLRQEDATRTEPTLDAIYDELKDVDGATSDCAEYLKNCELEDERRWLSARRPMIPVYKHALRSGKRLIAVSDSCHSSSFLRSVLEKNGYDKFEYVFVSSETGFTKASGHLFPYVLSQLDCSASRVFHLGDNEKSDGLNARNAGLRSGLVEPSVYRYFSSREKCYAWASYPRDLTTQFKLILGLIINNCFDRALEGNLTSIQGQDASDHVIGYAFLGPLNMLSRSSSRLSTDPLVNWLDNVSQSPGSPLSLANIQKAAKAFQDDCEALLGREFIISSGEAESLSEVFYQLLSEQLTEQNAELAQDWPPALALGTSQPSLLRRMEISLLERHLFKRAYIRLLTNRSAFFANTSHPALRLYSKILGLT
jgi:HAD superfamily hydrolase (TIGR01549 family)